MIGRVQEHLEAIYGIRCERRATEFLMDEEAAQRLGGTGRASEELLVQEEDGELWLGLVLSRDVLARLEAYEAAAPDAVLDEAFVAYCQLAEGVSHFLYLTHSAGLDRQVSLLELEAQAEVDKFASCLLLRWNAGVGDWAEELLSRLFERVQYLPHLSPAERWRYQEANRLAHAYCRRLLTHVGGQRMDRLLADLRYSYRLGAEAKLRHLQG